MPTNDVQLPIGLGHTGEKSIELDIQTETDRELIRTRLDSGQSVELLLLLLLIMMMMMVVMMMMLGCFIHCCDLTAPLLV